MGFPALNAFANLFGSGVRLPSYHEARWITDNCKHSPDLAWLEQHEFQLLFACDDTKHGHSHHCLIEESAFLATAYTRNKFNFWVQEVGKDRLPIPMEATSDNKTIRYFPPALKVKGELHIVRTPQFKELDNYKQNTVQFRRKRVNVIVPYRKLTKIKNVDENIPIRPLPRQLQGNLHSHLSPEAVYLIRAWMYVGKPEYWDNVLDAGFRGFKPVNYYESKREWLKEYYDYPRQNLESS